MPTLYGIFGINSCYIYTKKQKIFSENRNYFFNLFCKALIIKLLQSRAIDSNYCIRSP